MNIKQFIKDNKALIDSFIKESGSLRFNDSERRLFILNNEYLYNLAQKRGLK